MLLAVVRYRMFRRLKWKEQTTESDGVIGAVCGRY